MQHNGSTTNPGAKGSNARCGKYARLFQAPAGALVQCFDCAPPICRVKLWGKMTLLKSYLNVNGPRLGTPLRVGRASEPMCELGFGQCSARLQAGTVESIICSPNGECYSARSGVTTRTL